MRVGRILLFDWKAMGFNFYIPLLIMIFLYGYASLTGFTENNFVPSISLAVPPLAAWWSIYLMQHLLEEQGGEVLFSYPISIRILGLGRVLLFYLVFELALFILILGVCSYQIGYAFNFFVQLSIQSLFFASLGFMAMVYTKNTSWSLFIVATYASTQILTNGIVMPLINVYFFRDRILLMEEIWGKLFIITLLSIGVLLTAQHSLNRTEKFK
ncbi:hypothetical protein ACFO9Q_03875 [Paenibacillus sp. GCM10023252]|uniref:hypothetical protein n=1 Tax=Paenibacillus sp. GCM10023252 TaxID=3252649 RepID=UPI00361FE97B